jgi:hypothetical protein
MVIIAPLVMNLLHGPAADQAGMPKLTLGRILTSRRPNPRCRYLDRRPDFETRREHGAPYPFALQSRQAEGTQEGQA